MSWILILIQLLPTLIKLVQMIREWIDKIPSRSGRQQARAELCKIARKHVCALTPDGQTQGPVHVYGGQHYTVVSPEAVQSELERLLESVKARAEQHEHD